MEHLLKKDFTLETKNQGVIDYKYEDVKSTNCIDLIDSLFRVSANNCKSIIMKKHKTIVKM